MSLLLETLFLLPRGLDSRVQRRYLEVHFSGQPNPVQRALDALVVHLSLHGRLRWIQAQHQRGAIIAFHLTVCREVTRQPPQAQRIKAAQPPGLIQRAFQRGRR